MDKKGLKRSGNKEQNWDMTLSSRWMNGSKKGLKRSGNEDQNWDKIKYSKSVCYNKFQKKDWKDQEIKTQTETNKRIEKIRK